MTKELVRSFPLGEEFMNYKTNDLLYSFLRYLSTAEPVLDEEGNQVMTDKGNPQYKEYLLESEYKKVKKTLSLICSCSIRTIDRHKDDLIKKGLLQEDKIKIKNSFYKCFRFPMTSDTFQKVEKDLIKYLIDTRNVHCIKIYIYLRNKYEWKAKSKEKYYFTVNEISQALGYAESTKSADPIINNILNSFKLEGMINFTTETITITTKNGEVVNAPYKRLDFVETSFNNLQKKMTL